MSKGKKKAKKVQKASVETNYETTYEQSPSAGCQTEQAAWQIAVTLRKKKQAELQVAYRVEYAAAEAFYSCLYGGYG